MKSNYSTDKSARSSLQI